jgi:CheY-like chemotaxis protein/two-component sensor histidine kinase
VTDDVAALRAENERLRDELRTADKRREEFLALLAHELRNPLAPIQTSIYLMKKRVPAGLVDRHLEIVERQASNLARIVDDLLDASRITRGRIELKKERLDLAAAVVRALEAARSVLDAHGTQVVFSSPAAPVHVDADPMRIEQIVLNLVSNASKYGEPGGRVWITVERVDGAASLRVKDEGAGMPPELLPHVFDLFHQGGFDGARVQGGLGIGLTVVKNLVELHGGRVEAKSEGIGRGSELVVHLPLAAEERAPPRRLVLVVEDHRDTAEMLAEVLHELGHAALVAFDGPSALKLVEERDPDVVLLDIGLPGMDGYEVARAIRTRGRRSVLVALTGYGEPSDVARSRDAGFAHHLVKPPDVQALADVLDGD